MERGKTRRPSRDCILAFASDWLRGWREFPGPITKQRWVTLKQSGRITFDTQLKIGLKMIMSIRAIYNFLLSVDGDLGLHWICFTSLCDWSRNSGHPFNQSVEKLKPIANLFIRIFSHFRNFVNCLAWILIMMFPFVPISRSYFFSQFWLYNPRSKIGLRDCTSRKWKGHMIDGTYFCNAQNIYSDQTLLT